MERAEYVVEIPLRIRQSQHAPSEFAKILAEALEAERLDPGHVPASREKTRTKRLGTCWSRIGEWLATIAYGVEFDKGLVQGGDDGAQQTRMQVRFGLVDKQQRALLDEAHNIAEDRYHKPLPSAQRRHGGVAEIIVARGKGFGPRGIQEGGQHRSSTSVRSLCTTGSSASLSIRPISATLTSPSVVRRPQYL